MIPENVREAIRQLRKGNLDPEDVDWFVLELYEWLHDIEKEEERCAE